MNRQTIARVYRGKEREARERRRTRSELNRIATLSRQLAGDLNYAFDPTTQLFWGSSQRRRLEWSIARKKRETLSLIRSLPEPFKEELLDLTEEIWAAAIADDPAAPLLRQQAELLAEARAELAPTQRALAAAQRMAA
jgi:hypothetical protein